MFSSRARLDSTPNRIAEVISHRRASGAGLIDLTASNPTTCGLDYPHAQIGEALAIGALSPYQPEPLGIASAREAVAAHLRSRGESATATDVAITASTSEAYGYLFKLLADPGDQVVTARPAYPLLEHLAQSESLAIAQFPLARDGRWHLDVDALAGSIGPRTRAVALVHPNNPTGSYLTLAELREVAGLCAARGIALISDEVFHDYPIEARAGAARSAADYDLPCLTFSLGGLSKSAGMPHLKLGWIRVGGPQELRVNALRGLEAIGDDFLAVATPVQVALPRLFEIGATVRDRIRARTRLSLIALRQILSAEKSIEVLPVEGGWSAVVRVPRIVADEDLALALVEYFGVIIHPGYFFDFESDGWLVVSLLSPQEDIEEGARPIAELVAVLAAP
ncbi:MAG: pyridoxal phosphate-dependent aminotransferase [Thermoanaerobaculia bacterium]|nr:pyridoxal phosphate-dependent aminotransferase [Thermoanaerobaculia bacterium]